MLDQGTLRRPDAAPGRGWLAWFSAEGDGRKWLIVAVLHLTSAFGNTITGTKGVFFPELIREFHLSHTVGAALLSANTLVAGAVSLACGFLLLRRMAPQTFLAGTTFLIGAGFFVASMAQDYNGLLAAYVLMAGGGAHLVVIPFVVANWFSSNRGLAMAAALSGTTTGGVVFTPLTSWVVSEFGWRAGYQMLAVAIIAIVPPLLLAVVRTRPPGQEAPAPGTSAAGVTGMTLREAVRTRSYWLILTGYIIFWATTNGYFLHFISALRETGYSPAEAASTMSLLFLLAAATKLIFGFFSDRTNVRYAISLALVMSAVGMFLISRLPQGGDEVLLGGFAILYGLSYSAPLVLFPVMVSQVFGKRYFTLIDATIMVSGSVCGSLGGVFAGWIFDTTGTYRLAFEVFAVSLLLIAFTLLAVVIRKPEPAAEKHG